MEQIIHTLEQLKNEIDLITLDGSCLELDQQMVDDTNAQSAGQSAEEVASSGKKKHQRSPTEALGACRT